MTRIKAAVTMLTVVVAAGLLGSTQKAQAGPFTATVFARGTDVSATSPDSITYGGGHVFIEYSNGASSRLTPGTDGSSTIAEYDLSGRVLTSVNLGGSVDGLRYNAATNQLWALQNQDGNSALTTIDATTFAMVHYSYGQVSTNRGYDDATFVGGNAYLSFSNPGNSTDPATPIIFQATLANNLVNLTPVLAANAAGINTATNQTGPIPVTDPDSLHQRPDGSLLLTGGDDGSLTTVRNPGTNTQSVSFVSLVDTSNRSLSALDDTVFAGSGNQQLLVADTRNNLVYSISGPFQPGGAYSSIGSTNSVDSVNLTTGVATSISDGLFAANASPHGEAFVPSVPEPSSLLTAATAVLAGLGYAWRRRK